MARRLSIQNFGTASFPLGNTQVQLASHPGFPRLFHEVIQYFSIALGDASRGSSLSTRRRCLLDFGRDALLCSVLASFCVLRRGLPAGRT